MKRQIVILGGGTGGTLAANRLRRRLTATRPRSSSSTATTARLPARPAVRPLRARRSRGDRAAAPRQLHAGIDFREREVDRRRPRRGTRPPGRRHALPYDVLVVATGARLQPEETEGLTGPGWNERVFTFYDLGQRDRAARRAARFDGGRLVVNLVDMPIKCPVAPLEFCFLADWYLRERGVRDRGRARARRRRSTARSPSRSRRSTSPACSAEKGIALETEFAPARSTARRQAGLLRRPRGAFDLLVTIPLHGGAAYVARSPGLGDELGFVPTDPHTLQAHGAPNVFALGDATNLPTSKAGSVTHFEGETLVENVARFLAGEPLEAAFDGHANCFIETGFHKALLIDFNYDTEPLPGRFPTALGPLPLLSESRLNHMGKLMFQWVYWHVLLPGRDIPGIGADDADRRASSTSARRRRGGRDDHDPDRRAPVDVDAEGFLPTRTSGTRRSPRRSRARTGSRSSPTATGWSSASCATVPRTGTAPSIRTLGKASGVPIKELYELFPKGPAKLAAKIGGIPKPRGCI